MDSTITPSPDTVKPSELAELRADIARAGTRHKDIADAAGLSASQFSLRINGKRPISVDDLLNIRAAFMLLTGEVSAEDGEPVAVTEAAQ